MTYLYLPFFLIKQIFFPTHFVCSCFTMNTAIETTPGPANFATCRAEIEAKHAALYAKYPTDETFEHWFVLRAPKYLARACTTLHKCPRNLAAGLVLIPYDLIMFVPALYTDYHIKKEMRERYAKFNL